MIGYTHAGIFHADDVFSTVLLKMVFPDIKIERVFKAPEEAEDAIIYDIGKGKFDHHQPDSPVRDNGVPYAACGLLWKEFGHKLLEDPEDFEDFDKDYIQQIDWADNTGERNQFSQMIADFNAEDASDKAAQDAAFNEAVEYASVAFGNRIKVIKHARDDLNEVLNLMNENDGTILIMDRCFASWKRAAIGSSYKFVVYPSLRGGWNVQGVPDAQGSPKTVVPFPEEWRGVSGNELESISGIKGLSFCHKNAFLCAVDDISTAKIVAEYAINHESTVSKE